MKYESYKISEDNSSCGFYAKNQLVMLPIKKPNSRKTVFLCAHQGVKRRIKMQKFFEEYGWVIVAAVIITIMILMSTPLGDMLKESFMDLITKLTGKFDAIIG